VGLLVNLAILAFAYRSWVMALFACLPCLLGLLLTLALFAVAHIPLNLVSASALVLVLGCGVDYGIFVLQEAARSPSPSPVEGALATGVESMGVLLASLSTLAGFGTLVLASHRALQSLGASVGLGVLISAVTAIFVLPGLVKGARRWT
jgi:predicted RND superfamily exporter protein